MGYYTEYEVHGSEEFIQTLFEVSDDAVLAIQASGKSTGRPCKWHDWQEDMIRATAKHTGEMVMIQGVGEERGHGHVDMWRAWFYDGRLLRKDLPKLQWDDPPVAEP